MGGGGAGLEGAPGLGPVGEVGVLVGGMAVVTDGVAPGTGAWMVDVVLTKVDAEVFVGAGLEGGGDLDFEVVCEGGGEVDLEVGCGAGVGPDVNGEVGPGVGFDVNGEVGPRIGFDVSGEVGAGVVVRAGFGVDCKVGPGVICNGIKRVLENETSFFCSRRSLLHRHSAPTI